MFYSVYFPLVNYTYLTDPVPGYQKGQRWCGCPWVPSQVLSWGCRWRAYPGSYAGKLTDLIWILVLVLRFGIATVLTMSDQLMNVPVCPVNPSQLDTHSITKFFLAWQDSGLKRIPVFLCFAFSSVALNVPYFHAYKWIGFSMNPKKEFHSQSNNETKIAGKVPLAGTMIKTLNIQLLFFFTVFTHRATPGVHNFNLATTVTTATKSVYGNQSRWQRCCCHSCHFHPPPGSSLS